MIAPTVGRVVWFYPIEKVAQPYAALVTYVWHDRMINVGGFDPNGKPFASTSVTLLQDDDAKPEGQAFCVWMPYQKGQAAKYEALEKQVTGG